MKLVKYIKTKLLHLNDQTKQKFQKFIHDVQKTLLYLKGQTKKHLPKLIKYTDPLKHAKSMFACAAILAFIFSLLRLSFFILHTDNFAVFIDVVLHKIIFQLGKEYLILFGFDFAFFIFWNSLFFLYWIYCEFKNKDPQFKKRKCIFYAFNLPLFILFFMDMQTLAVRDHLFNFSILSAFRWDIVFNIWILLRDYWILAVLMGAALFLVLKFSFIKPPTLASSASRKQERWFFLKITIPSFLAFLFIFCVEIPSPSLFLHHLKSNGMYYRIFSSRFYYSSSQIPKHHYIFFKRKKLKTLLPLKEKVLCPHSRKQMNIVIFVIESFNRYLMTPELTPFLFSLSENGLFSKNHFSTHRGTKSSVFQGILESHSNTISFEHPPFSPLTAFQNTALFFFFGDYHNTFRFHKTLPKLGFQYLNADTYLKETGMKNHQGTWGDILEKPFLEWASQKLKNNTQFPFLTLILTNQPHYPFHCPPEVIHGKKSTKNFRLCLKYVDRSIKNFFQKIENTPWFSNTLFVITGDHTSLEGNTASINSESRNPQTFSDKYNVPLIFWQKGQNLKRYHKTQVSRHSDILPSIANYFGFQFQDPAPFVLSNFIFCPENKQYLVYQEKKKWMLESPPYLLEYTPLSRKSVLYKVHKRVKNLNFDPAYFMRNPSKPNPYMMNKTIIHNNSLKQSLTESIQAYLQYYHHGL